MFSDKKIKQTAKCPNCATEVTLTVMAMHQHLASVHFMKSVRSGGICVTASHGHADCPPTTTCLLREARKFVREREQPAPAAVLRTPGQTPLPVAALSSASQPPTAEPGPTTSELRDLLIQANETNKALSARLDVLAADAAKRNKKARDLDRSPTQYQDHKRSSRSRDDRKRSSRSRDARKRSSRSRDDDVYIRWAQQLDDKAAIEKKADAEATAKAEKEAHTRITYACMFEYYTHTHTQKEQVRDDDVAKVPHTP